MRVPMLESSLEGSSPSGISATATTSSGRESAVAADAERGAKAHSMAATANLSQREAGIMVFLHNALELFQMDGL